MISPILWPMNRGSVTLGPVIRESESSGSLSLCESSPPPCGLELKWLATSFCRRQYLISDWWLFIHVWSAFLVSPTYRFLHFIHLIMSTMWAVLQLAMAFTGYAFLMTELLKVFICWMCQQVLQQTCWHREFPLYKCCLCANWARTNKVLKLGGHRCATRGGFLTASCLSFPETLRMEDCLSKFF